MPHSALQEMRSMFEDAAMLFILVVYVAILPNLQLGASFRLHDGSICWLVRKSHRGRTRIGSAIQVAAAISAFSMLWFIIHGATRYVMHLELFVPLYERFSFSNGVNVFEELTAMSFVLSAIALLCETFFAPLLLLAALSRDRDLRCIPLMLPWLLVAMYTFWILFSPLFTG